MLLLLAVISWTTTVAAVPVPALCMRETSASGIVFERTLHSAAALGAMTLLFTMHRAIMTSGFTLTRRIYSTDALISGALCLLTAIWSGLVFISGYKVGDRPCSSKGLDKCLSRLAFVPWIMVVMSLAWCYWLLDAISHGEMRRKSNTAVGIWKMVVETGPYSWKHSTRSTFIILIYLAMLGAIAITSYGAVRSEDYTIAILNLVGLALVIADAGGQNKYCSAPHLCRADNIRIPLTTTHNSSIVYILPSYEYGFDAVYSPKIEAEHRSFDERVASLFGPLAARKGLWSSFDCIFKLKEIVNDRNKHIVRLTDQEILYLAEWLYCRPMPNGKPNRIMRSIRCSRLQDVNLIGRELMMAMMQTEYLLFELRDRLPPRFKKEWTRLRDSKYSGAEKSIVDPPIGFARSGKEGYQDAVRHVYHIFGLENPETSAIDPQGSPPKFSEAINAAPDSIDDYVAKVWDMCCSSESTVFGALYLFSGVWYIEMGNVGGFHIAPLQPLNRSKQGDLTAWNVIWRQAWYTAIIAQLVTMSPTILSAFLGGVLQ